MPLDFASISTPFRMQPGLRRQALGSQQLTPNDEDSRASRKMLDGLPDHASQALVAVARFDPAPALRALMQHAATRHPSDFTWNGASVFESVRLGWRMCDGSLAGDGPAAIGACLRALPPVWRLPGLSSLALAEDFAVIVGASACIPWLAVCLPSRWAFGRKSRSPFRRGSCAGGRQPIAGRCCRSLGAARHRHRALGTLRVEHRQRFRLDAAPAAPAAFGAAGLARRTRCRCPRAMRQLSHRAPDLHSGAPERQAVFTIHVDTVPLDSAVSTASSARQLHDALASMSPAMLADHGFTFARERLLAWLDARSAVPR